MKPDFYTSTRRKLASLVDAVGGRRPSVGIKDLAARYDLNQLQRFEAVLQSRGFSLRQFTSMLDFGCGPGRHITHLLRVLPQAQIFGCDISRRNIDRCRKAYPMAHFFQNTVGPPVEFDNNQFDFIYSYSVFTHLTEENHKKWLRELARILKPGGVMLHTTHSYECLCRLQFWSPERLDKYKVREPIEALTMPEERYHYAPESELTPEYGYTIISQEYVMNNWPKYSGAKILRYVPGAIEAYPEGCQDIVLMEKLLK